jgi:hypothetical protein
MPLVKTIDLINRGKVLLWYISENIDELKKIKCSKKQYRAIGTNEEPIPPKGFFGC